MGNDRRTLVLDLGSSRIRCAAVAHDRFPQAAGLASAPYPIGGARSGTLARSFNTRLLRDRLFGVLRQAACAAGPRNVAAVAIIAQRGAACFLDAHLRDVYAGPQTDFRAVFEGPAIDAEHAARVYAATGHLPSMLFAPAKLRWWRRNRPRQAGRIAKACGLDAWAALQLAGALAETPHGLAELGLLDVAAREPARALLNDIGAPPDIAPCVVPLGAAVGRLTAEAARATGLPAAVEVHVAGPDSQAAAVGSGAVADGDVSIAAGWSAPVQATTPTPVFDPDRRTWTTLHALDGKWVAEANAGDAGGAVDAVRRLLGPRMTSARFDALADSASDSAGAVTAFLGPRALDMSGPGVTMGGLLAPAPVTLEGLDAPSVARAALENAAFAVRESLELARSVASPTLPTSGGRVGDGVALSGGMGESRVFASLLADALGEPVRVHRNAAPVGAALIATTPPGELGARSAELAASGLDVSPGPGAAEAGERYERWLRIRERLDALAGEL